MSQGEAPAEPANTTSATSEPPTQTESPAALIAAIVTVSGTIFVAAIANPNLAWAVGLPLILGGVALCLGSFLAGRRAAAAAKTIRFVSILPIVLGVFALLSYYAGRQPAVPVLRAAASSPVTVNPAEVPARTNTSDQPGFIGLETEDVPPGRAVALGLTEGDHAGALVNGVEDGPAQQIGIQPGDIIRSFAGSPVTDSSDLKNKVHDAAPNSVVPIDYLNNGRLVRKTIRIAAAR